MRPPARTPSGLVHRKFYERVGRASHVRTAIPGACVDLSGREPQRTRVLAHSSLRIDECLERVAFVSHGVMGLHGAGGPMAVAAAYLSAAIGDRWQSSVTTLKPSSVTRP